MSRVALSHELLQGHEYGTDPHCMQCFRRFTEHLLVQD